jgi:hypothetical protein
VTAPAAPDRAERVRRAGAPVVALLASALAVTCLLSVVLMLRSLPDLLGLDAGLVGWVGLGATTSLLVAAMSLLSAYRVGSGPPLALGAVAAAFGLSVGHDITGQAQLLLAVTVCGAAVGALLGGVAGMLVALPASWTRAVTTAWALPLVAGWPVLVRLAARDNTGRPDVVTQVGPWVFIPAVLVIVAWGVFAMLVEPAVQPAASRAWQSPWTVLLVASVGAGLVATLLGFQSDIALVWLRPVVVVATVAVAAGAAVALATLPHRTARLAFVGLAVVTGLVLPTATFALSGVSDPSAPPGWTGVVLTTLAAVAGAAAAALWPRQRLLVVPLGLLSCAASAVAVWVISDATTPMTVAVGALLAGAGAVVCGCLLAVSTDGDARGLMGFVLVCGLVLGSLVAVPLSWALLGEIPRQPGQLWAAGRLLAGLAVAASGIGAAYTWIIRGRLLAAAGLQGRRSAPGPPDPAVGLQDLRRR